VQATGGAPCDERPRHRQPLSGLRRRAARAVLSALAGGGLTALGLGGILPGRALAVDVPAGAPTSTDGPAEVIPAPDAGAEAQQTGAGGLSTSTSTTPPSSTTSTTSSPASVSAGPASTAPQAAVPGPGGAANVPVVRLQRSQKTTGASNRERKLAHAGPKGARRKVRSSRRTTATRHSSAPPPQLAAQLAADRLQALAAELTFSGASSRSLAFYRIPLFLLPIYRAAAVRYGVPWQILAAINEVETDYGNDLSVSTAGAVGWMQFMPQTWMLYGVDALNAGDADPYNPVDAIFAAARYLRDMGAAKNLPAAILAYNHSAAYVQSVMLRAGLISTYPKPVIATLASLADGRLPLTGGHLAWEVLHPRASSSPSTAAAAATGLQAGQLADVRGARNAAVVAVQAGRIVGSGSSRKLGMYVVLRDPHGDVFTYSGLASIASSYVPAGSATGGRSRADHRSVGARDRRLPLRRGALVEEGTVLGRVRVPIGAKDGHLRFAIRPAGDQGSIDPGPILASWAQLAAALHPAGARGRLDPLDAVASVQESRLRRGAATSLGSSTAAAMPARAAHSGRRMQTPIVVLGEMSAGQWDELIARIGALPAPAVAVKQGYRATGGWDAVSDSGMLEQSPPSSSGLGR
jgi:membrane-bound lytic murein transglycosylase B